MKKITNKDEGLQGEKLNIKQPILFIHGSFHSSWCFKENYMSYFNQLGIIKTK